MTIIYEIVSSSNCMMLSEYEIIALARLLDLIGMDTPLEEIQRFMPIFSCYSRSAK